MDRIYREDDAGKFIPGVILPAFSYSDKYYYVNLQVYQDGMVDDWGGGHLVPLDEFKRQARTGYFATRPAEGARVSLSDLSIECKVIKTGTGVELEDFLAQVDDELCELNGQPTASDLCLDAFATYQQDPSDAVPQHRRAFLGMGFKEGKIRQALGFPDRSQRDAELRMHGWELLGDAEYRAVWDRFYDNFNFRPSIDPKDFPGIREPHPSVTWALPKLWDETSEADLCATFLAAFRSCTPPSQAILALDWQHDCYWFRPHDFQPPTVFDEDDWPVPVRPNGDYYIFLAPDMAWGVFGHPWEKTMCVFGEPLLNMIMERPPQVFSTIVRQG